MSKGTSMKKDVKKKKKDTAVLKGAVPDLAKVMDKVPTKNLKSLKVKLKFSKDDDD